VGRKRRGGLGYESTTLRTEDVGPGPDRQAAHAGGAPVRRCLNRGASAPDAWAPVGSGRERERRGVWAGPGKKGVRQARMNRKRFDLFN
jgi:hypothetical protein